MTVIIEGAAIALAGVLVGRFLPNRHKGPEPGKGTTQPVCGCEHHRSYHDPETGHCGHVEQIYSGNGRYTPNPCGCRQYSGPVPLPEYYAPEITGGSQ